MNHPRLSPDIWYLVFQCLPSNDLKNICAVSKLFDALATPLLYRSIRFCGKKGYKLPDSEDVKDQDEAEDLSFGLFCRLLDDRNECLRLLVQNVTVDPFTNEFNSFFYDNTQFPPENFVRLLKKLPNLENLYFKFAIPMSKSFVDALLSHPNSPSVHLLRENGRRQLKDSLPLVRALNINIDLHDMPSSREEPFTPQRLALHELFAVYPNLENLSVHVNSLLGGCVLGGPRSPTMLIPLKLSLDERFPPLRALSLSGYAIRGEERSVWEQKFPWQNLQSLSLGVQNCEGFLELATGQLQNLRELEIKSYGWGGWSDELKTHLDTFLSSFHTLESLITKAGCLPSISAVTTHPGLTYLSLHAIEQYEQERQILDVDAIEELARKCQKLTSLEIDMNQNNHGWPEDIMKSIATGFKGLRRLSIHIALGLSETSTSIETLRKQRSTLSNPKQDSPKDENPVEPYQNSQKSLKERFNSVLTEQTTLNFANRFVHYRNLSPPLEKIELKTGEQLRWFPQWWPHWAQQEKESSRTFEIYSQENGQQPEIKELESGYNREMKWREELFQDFWGDDSKSSKPPRISRAPRIYKR